MRESNKLTSCEPTEREQVCANCILRFDAGLSERYRDFSCDRVNSVRRCCDRSAPEVLEAMVYLRVNGAPLPSFENPSNEWHLVAHQMAAVGKIQELLKRERSDFHAQVLRLRQKKVGDCPRVVRGRHESVTSRT